MARHQLCIIIIIIIIIIITLLQKSSREQTNACTKVSSALRVNEWRTTRIRRRWKKQTCEKFGDVIPHRQFLVKEKTEIPRDRIRHHRGRDVGERHSVTFPELLPSAEP